MAAPARASIPVVRSACLSTTVRRARRSMRRTSPARPGRAGSRSDDIPTSKQDASAPAVVAAGLSHF